MKVTLVVCDRCGRELPEDAYGEKTLELKLRYHDPEGDWQLMRQRESIELCPPCRDSFAEWLGERGEAMEGLRANGSTEAAILETLQLRSGEIPLPGRERR